MKKLMLSGLVAVSVTSGVWWMLRNEQKKIAATYKMVTVLRTRKYIPSGKPVVADMVEEMPVPEAYAPPGAVNKKADLLDEHGTPRFKVRINLPKGEMLTKSTLVNDATLPGLAWVLATGEVAVSLRLNSEEAVAGLIKPGDWVHFFSTRPTRARMVLPHVRVAAVGDRVWDQNSSGEAADLSKTMAGDSILITLILSPREALMARLAAAQGPVTLALASPLDTEPPQHETVRWSDKDF